MGCNLGESVRSHTVTFSFFYLIEAFIRYILMKTPSAGLRKLSTWSLVQLHSRDSQAFYIIYYESLYIKKILCWDYLNWFVQTLKMGRFWVMQIIIHKLHIECTAFVPCSTSYINIIPGSTASIKPIYNIKKPPMTWHTSNFILRKCQLSITFTFS